eukprot:742320-Pyramimonas_sp.AAC.1
MSFCPPRGATSAAGGACDPPHAFQRRDERANFHADNEHSPRANTRQRQVQIPMCVARTRHLYIVPR